jgi:exodeoxyribonuclease VII large subunit
VPRPPFDPSKALGGLFDPVPRGGAERPPEPKAEPKAERAPDRGEEPPAKQPPNEMTVTAFSELISRTLEQGMRGTFRVAGEVANFSDRKHWYFSLKDGGAVLSCVMWSSDAARAQVRPREGDAVVVTGRIGHYAPQGRTQLYATRIERQGVGSIEEEFQRLVKELRGLGYFEESRKKPLPAMPKRVAVVTSAAGAALTDVVKTAQERCPAVEFLVVDVKVQGDGAADEVARALRALDRRRGELGIDAVIVTRGGGSREDLWAFNERVVADAAFAMRLPLVAAIGHEVDTSIIELVADRRASTPTQAVMLLLPDLGELDEQLARRARDLTNAMRFGIARRREALARLAGSPALATPGLRVERARARLVALGAALRDATTGSLADERRALDGLGARLAAVTPAARAATARARLAGLAPRLARAIDARARRMRLELDTFDRRLRSAGPEETIRRGYAVVTDARGAVVRSVGAVAVGDGLAIRVADGTIDASVRSVRGGGGGGRGDDQDRATGA